MALKYGSEGRAGVQNVGAENVCKTHHLQQKSRKMAENSNTDLGGGGGGGVVRMKWLSTMSNGVLRY